MNGSIIHIPDKESIAQFGERPAKIPSLAHALIVDAHVDLPYYMMKMGHELPLSQLNQGPFTVQKAKEEGIRLFCTALYCEDEFNGGGAFGRYQEIMRFIERYFDTVQIVTEKDELKALSSDPERLGTILLLENADFLADGQDAIEELLEDGVKIVGLTHMGKNRLGDGSGVAFANGLTDKGKEVVKSLSTEGLILDVAHLHPRTFWDLLDLVEVALVSTHTGIRDVYDIPRNLDLEQVREIFDRNGMIGITFNPEMLGHGVSIQVEEIFMHLDVVVQRFGPEQVGIGSDLCGFEKCVGDMEDIRGIERLVEKMDSHGYGDQAISGILGGNWYGFFEKNL